MGLGVFVSEMGRKQQGLWEEEEGKPEVYSANVFYNNISEIAKVRGQGQRQSGEGLGPHLHGSIDFQWDSAPSLAHSTAKCELFLWGTFSYHLLPLNVTAPDPPVLPVPPEAFASC